MTRIESNKRLATFNRQELEISVKELGWRIVGRTPTPDGSILQCICDERGVIQGVARVIEDEEASLTP